MSDDPWDAHSDRLGKHFLGGARWRIAASIAAPVVWLAAILLFFGFWAQGLTVVQDVIVGVVSALGLLAFLLLVWISFGLGFAARWLDG